MGKKSLRELENRAVERFATRLDTQIAQVYGVLGLSTGPRFRSRLGYKVVNLEDGGLCIRVSPKGEIAIRVRLILGYRIRAISIALSVEQLARYLLIGTGLSIQSCEVLVDGVRFVG